MAAGERIGAVGTSGTRSAQQPHLHFGVRDAGSLHGDRDPGRQRAAFLRGGDPREAPALQPAPALSAAHRTGAGDARRLFSGSWRRARRALLARRGGERRRAYATQRGCRPEAGGRIGACAPRERGAPGRSRAPAGRRSGSVTLAQGRSRASARIRAPAGAVHPGRAGSLPRWPPSSRVSGPRPGPGPVAGASAAAGGPDWGLVLACLGLLGAAALLGLPRTVARPAVAAAGAAGLCRR